MRPFCSSVSVLGVTAALLTIRAMLPLPAIGGEAYEYDPEDTSCGGFPVLPVETAAGTCMGLVVAPEATDNSGRYNMLMPRKIVQLPDGDFVISDVGRWHRSVGRLWRLRRHGPADYRLELLFRNLAWPFGLEIGPDGLVYVGLADSVVRFDPDNPTGLTSVVGGFDLSDEPLHPLKEIAFGVDGSLYVNNGSVSDHCEMEVEEASCAESAAYGQVWVFSYLGDGKWSESPEVYATGLRNSAALLALPDGRLLQAENSTDYEGETAGGQFVPYDEVNLLIKGGNYGWPYLANGNEVHPAWGENLTANRLSTLTRRSRAPLALLPPHAAPLDMAMVGPSRLFPERGIIMSWHGWADTGGRIVFVQLDDGGLPLRVKGPAYYEAYTGTGVERRRYPAGKGAAPALDLRVLTPGWGKQEGRRPQGSPVGVVEARDGSIWITDDRFPSVIRLALPGGTEGGN